MSGVEILYSWQVGPRVGMYIVGGFFVALGVVGLICALSEILKSGFEVWMLLPIVICLIMWISGAGLVMDESKINETHYKVKIEDSVTFNEFVSKYEIIDQEGEIWEVKELTE